MGSFIAGCFVGSCITIVIMGLLASNRTNEDYYDTEERNV